MPLSKLHERYGTIVRIGPNVLSFTDPNAIKEIYNRRFVKVGRNTARLRAFLSPMRHPILTDHHTNSRISIRLQLE